MPQALLLALPAAAKEAEAEEQEEAALLALPLPALLALLLALPPEALPEGEPPRGAEEAELQADLLALLPAEALSREALEL